MLAAVLTGRQGGTVLIFGLPGNPVSAMVTCTRIVLPVLAACAGAARNPASLVPRLVELAGDDGKRIGLWWHRPALLRVREDGVTVAELVDTRGSGDVIAAARSDGFVELPPGKGSSSGDESAVLVPFYPWPG
jgi:molybdopterin biosynthesis enzyme